MYHYFREFDNVEGPHEMYKWWDWVIKHHLYNSEPWSSTVGIMVIHNIPHSLYNNEPWSSTVGIMVIHNIPHSRYNSELLYHPQLV